jgi:hypothetical protein
MNQINLSGIGHNNSVSRSYAGSIDDLVNQSSRDDYSPAPPQYSYKKKVDARTNILQRQ